MQMHHQTMQGHQEHMDQIVVHTDHQSRDPVPNETFVPNETAAIGGDSELYSTDWCAPVDLIARQITANRALK
jgi:hypothetical protein